MNSDFKTRIGRKMMFCWEHYTMLRAVSGESFQPKGVCTVTVTSGAKLFKAECAVLVNSTHDVILGIDFLKECGATVDCGAGEVLLSAFCEEPMRRQQTIAVIDNITLPAQSIVRVPVEVYGVAPDSTGVIVDPIQLTCAKKEVFLQCCVISTKSGRSLPWVVNSSFELTVLPSGVRLAVFEQDTSDNVSTAVISDDQKNGSDVACPNGDIFLGMVKKSLSSEKRETLV